MHLWCESFVEFVWVEFIKFKSGHPFPLIVLIYKLSIVYYWDSNMISEIIEARIKKKYPKEDVTAKILLLFDS